MSINCNMDGLPSLDDLDPEAAYFSWTIQIKAEKGEEGIRQVFEFAEWDCDLEIKLLEVEAAVANEELPMVPVPFDLSALDEGPEAGGEADETVAAAV